MKGLIILRSPWLQTADATFDESAMLRQGKESVDRDQDANKQVELEVEAPETVRENTSFC